MRWGRGATRWSLRSGPAAREGAPRPARVARRVTRRLFGEEAAKHVCDGGVAGDEAVEAAGKVDDAAGLLGDQDAGKAGPRPEVGAQWPALRLLATSASISAPEPMRKNTPPAR